ncbi:hypothetical protein G7072_18200 [Nocardioides sp. HDW12B]|uniref:hypothetical protein n=1 Tax=Nocardioides sp. HDW12B TaxID=2714939 RepID=UPI001409CADD|nr:hypothetical protein [Nocardioides sp. HDW12B]QIK68018.1 hypothetical protein G7072_18200 [Nocardioides sp. HDW12B]
MHLLLRIPAQHQRAVVKYLLLGATMCFLFAVLLIMAFGEESETSGHLWWKSTREVPYDQRLPYLLGGIALVALAAILFAAATWLTLHPKARGQRAEQRRLAEKLAFQTSTDEGRAQRAYERGDRGFAVTLRVDDGSHWPTLREVELQGWRQTDMRLRKAIKTSDVTPHWDGSHTVVHNYTQEATIYFVRRDHPN